MRFKGELVGAVDMYGAELREGDILEFHTGLGRGWSTGATGVVRYVDGWCHFAIALREKPFNSHIIDSVHARKIGSIYDGSL